MLCCDGFGGDQRLTLSVFIDSRHSEFILFTFLQVFYVTFGSTAELTDWLPLARLVLLFHHIVTDGRATIILGWIPGQLASFCSDVLDL
jgi:hypothetical protein